MSGPVYQASDHGIGGRCVSIFLMIQRHHLLGLLLWGCSTAALAQTEAIGQHLAANRHMLIIAVENGADHLHTRNVARMGNPATTSGNGQAITEPEGSIFHIDGDIGGWQLIRGQGFNSGDRGRCITHHQRLKFSNI